MKSNYFYTMHGSENISTKMHDEGSEEGEIVDSDEEQTMRQRIRELEAKNDELEKIASISGDFTNQYRYPADYPPYRNKLHPAVKSFHMSQKDVARIPSDASSISSVEMEPVRKRAKRKGRHSRKDHCRKCRSRSSSVHKHTHRTHKLENKFTKPEDSFCRKHNKLRLPKSNSPIVTNENYLETISLDSDEDSDESNSDYAGKDTSLHLNREELRFALARTKETKTRGNLLRERLYNGNALLDQKENINTCDVAIDSLEATKSSNNSHVSEQSLDNSDKEEQELRLIALKSAVLRKHLARKKRNAEMAYSPTDFSPVRANPIIADDNMDVVEEELDELNDVMEISPINSPKLILTPSNECDFKIAGDNNSIDMDIAQSGSEEEFNNNNKNDQWYPIEAEPVTKHSAENNEALSYPLPLHYGIYVPEMQYQLPPPNALTTHSELVDNKEQSFQSGMNMYADFIIDEQPPPPPSMCIEIIDDDDDEQPPKPPSMLSMIPNVFSIINYHDEPPPPPPILPDNESDSNVFQRFGSKIAESQDELQFLHICSPSSTNQIQSQVNVSDDENNDSDEEVSALRAVLLSKLQSSKSQKREQPVKIVPQQVLPNLEIVCHEEDRTDEDSVETILQKALRRLKSSVTSSSGNDATAVEVEEDYFVPETLVVTSNDETSEHEKASTKNVPRLEEKTTSPENEIEKNTESIDSKHASSIDKRSATIPPITTIDEELNEYQTQEAIGEIITESHANNSEAISISLDIGKNTQEIPTESNEAEKKEDAVTSSTICDEIGRTNITTNDQAKAKESRKVPVKEKPKQLRAPTPKSLVSNENSKTKEGTLKRKRLNSASSVNAPGRVQPLSVKNNLIPSVKPTLKTAQNLLQSTLSKMRTTRTTKIVRPNKVINKEITTNLKRSITPAGSPTPPPKIQRTIVNTSAKSTNSTLSATEAPPKIIVKKLVISLRASDTETSDEELMREVHVPIENSVDRLKNSYSEIASPLELLMNSASCSPARNRKTPIAVTTETSAPVASAASAAPAINAAFEQKLDAFLKGIRKKGSLEITPNESPKSTVIKKTDSVKNFNTPSAVRHLPLASQDEYRRLVHRMKLLEKQKQSKKSDEDVPFEGSISKNIPVKNSATQTKVQITEANAKSAMKKKLLLYENTFDQTSDNIVKLLNKSLSLVVEAKKVKIAKLRHEQQLQELRAEMARIQALYEQEDRKFSSMKQHIGTSNQFLTSLKKDRRNLLENANKLGRSLKGDKYRLNNKTGDEIIAKSRKLHAEIKVVNSMKTDNIESILLQSKSTKEICDSQSSSVILPILSEPNKSNNIEMHSNEKATTTTTVNEEPSEAEKENVVEPASEAQSSVEQTQEMKNEDSHEHCVEPNKTLMDITAEESAQNQTAESDMVDIVENDTRVELEIQHDDYTAEEADDNQCIEYSNSKSVVPVYISPLDHFRHEYRNIDSSAIICPYEMWGKCADDCCSYMHMTIGKRRGTELAFKPVNAEKL